MRRFAVIVTLGALLSMIGGATAATPALAGGRGDGWTFQDFFPGFTTVDGKFGLLGESGKCWVSRQSPARRT